MERLGQLGCIVCVVMFLFVIWNCIIYVTQYMETAKSLLLWGFGAFLAILSICVAGDSISEVEKVITRDGMITEALENIASSGEITKASYEQINGVIHVVRENEYSLTHLKNNEQGGYELITDDIVREHVDTLGSEKLESGDIIILRWYPNGTDSDASFHDYEVTVPSGSEKPENESGVTPRSSVEKENVRQGIDRTDIERSWWMPENGHIQFRKLQDMCVQDHVLTDS